MDLDDLSNSAVDAIEAGNYETAEEICQKLLKEYPEVFDGHERLAMLREAQARFQEAAEHYGKVLEMMKQNPRDVDPETIRYITELQDQALQKVKG